MKLHPLSHARKADVLAVKLPNCWGFVRVLQGSALGVWDVCSESPSMPIVDREVRPEKWFVYYLSPRVDETEMSLVGTMPFSRENHAWAPPCYTPPDAIERRYKIYYRGMYSYGNADDVAGMAAFERVTPNLLVEKMRKLHAAGELHLVPSATLHGQTTCAAREKGAHPNSRAASDLVMVEVHFRCQPETMGLAADEIADSLGDDLESSQLGTLMTMDSFGEISIFEVVLEVEATQKRAAINQIRKTLKRLNAPPSTRIIEVADTGNIEHPLVAPPKSR